jgi:hypothetical protein
MQPILAMCSFVTLVRRRFVCITLGLCSDFLAPDLDGLRLPWLCHVGHINTRLRSCPRFGHVSGDVFDVISAWHGLMNIAEYVVGGALACPYHCLSVYSVHYSVVVVADCCIIEVHSFHVWYVGGPCVMSYVQFGTELAYALMLPICHISGAWLAWRSLVSLFVVLCQQVLHLVYS